MSAPRKAYYTVPAAAKLLDVSPSTIWRWIQGGHLMAYRVGPRTIRIRRDDLETLVRPAGQGRRERHADASQRGLEAQASKLGNARVENVWFGYSAQRVRRALRKAAGALVGVNRDELLADIHAARQQQSHGRSA